MLGTKQLIRINLKKVIRKLHLLLFVLFLLFPLNCWAGDWPMWRYNANRGGASPDQLPTKLNLQWVRHLERPRPAWPAEQYMIQFDASYEPVVANGMMYVNSMVADWVTAYDADTGKEQWRFYADGPVRFAPLAWKGKVYFVSDDGYLYCVNGANGELLWKFRGGPSDRKILGNQRLISTWPARGAPVIYDGKLYFAAGIWPFMGIFIHALDASTGDVIWTNSHTGSIFIPQQHWTPAFGAAAPQGYLAASEDILLVSGGRSVPMGLNRHSGEFLYWHGQDKAFGRGGLHRKILGGYDISLWKDWFFNNGVLYKLGDGKGIAKAIAEIIEQQSLIGFDRDGALLGYTLMPKPRKLWKCPIQPILRQLGLDSDSSLDLHIKTGSVIFASGENGLITAIEISPEQNKAQVVWQEHVGGEIWRMLAADEKLFVVTKEGTIYCFGQEKIEPKKYELQYQVLPSTSVAIRKKVEKITRESGTKQGYCILMGSGDGSVMRQLLKDSGLYIIVLEGDINKVQRLRKQLEAAGLYGKRAAVLPGDILSDEIAPYLASLIICEDIHAGGFDRAGNEFIRKAFQCLRPYGGTLWLWAQEEEQKDFTKQLVTCGLKNYQTENDKKSIRLQRVGALPGSAAYTHLYANVANTDCSEDDLVKAPLGLLWFGDESDFTDVLPRHGGGPKEQVIGGRLFIEGIDSISARDVYTGRILWKRKLDNLGNYGIYYDYSYVPDPKWPHMNQETNAPIIAGTNARGTNYVVTEDGVYVLQGDSCHVLDVVTGKTLKVFDLPVPQDQNQVQWAYIGVYGDMLIAGSDFVDYYHLVPKARHHIYYLRTTTVSQFASKRLVVMNRHTGEVLWQRKSRHGFINNSIIAGSDKIFCLDTLSPHIEELMKAQNLEPPGGYFVYALEAATGKVLWEKEIENFANWLSYSQKHDALVITRRLLNEREIQKAQTMVCRGSDGKVIWERIIDHGKSAWHGPAFILRDDDIILRTSAVNLLTGEEKTRTNPMTDETGKWSYMLHYGCDTANGSKHLLTFRSSSGGYFDLANDGGTGNFGGFRSGCTANLVVADGLLNAPEYTRTCTCPYPNQTSLALIHMPEAEMWTINDIEPNKEPIKRVGINLGAPGDRKTDSGILWLNYPDPAAPYAPHYPAGFAQIPVKTTPEKPQQFCMHSSLVKSKNLPWVVASGLKDIREVEITVGNDRPRPYTVRLYFMEPEYQKRNLRIFDVALQGKTVLQDMDIAAVTGNSKCGLIKEFSDIMVTETLNVELKPSQKLPTSETILCGIEVIAKSH